MGFLFLVTKMNYEAERAMNQKRLRMDGEPGHGVVQGNGIPLNYMGKSCILKISDNFFNIISYFRSSIQTRAWYRFYVRRNVLLHSYSCKNARFEISFHIPKYFD